jgi:hypothetical protein
MSASEIARPLPEEFFREQLARRQANEMFCNSSARASIPSRALKSFSRVHMALSLW